MLPIVTLFFDLIISYRFFEAKPSKSLLKLSHIENYSIILYLGNMADILVYIFGHYKIATI